MPVQAGMLPAKSSNKRAAINMNIEEIIAKEDIILVDTCIASMPQGLLQDLYEFSDYSNINKDRLREGIDVINYMLNLLSYGNVHVTPEVYDELSMLDRHMTSCILDRPRSIPRSKKKNPAFKKGHKLFDELHSKVAEMRARSKQAIIEHYDTSFSVISSIVSLLTLEGNLKNMYNGKMNKDTDEMMIAYAIYESMFNNRATGILTRDKDLINILYSAARTLKSEFFNQSNEDIIRNLTTDPVSIFYKTEDDYSMILSTEKIPIVSFHKIFGISHQKNTDIMDKAANLWSGLNKYLANADKAYSS